MKLHVTQIVKKPLITEKATEQSDELNRYAFEVDRRANKDEIKSAIETLYDVRVVKVATQVKKGVSFRNRFGYGKTRSWKKAVVRVHEDDRIDFFK